jgi:hypothetical protein
MIAMALILVAAYTALAAWLGLRADRRFSRHASLPMQWWFDGRPTGYAPRRLALIAFPILSGAALVASALMVFIAPERSNLPAGQLAAFLAGMAALGIVLFVFYLWLVALWDRANP